MADPVQIIKSENDKKDYRYFKLPNGLSVLLAHDPEILEAGEGESGDDEDNQAEEVHDDDDGDDDDGTDDDDADDKPTKKAAAAMVVGVGSFSDPDHLQGLSHYLEHMLFMGSEKFPDENEYDSYLTRNGGSANAYTELEYTNYHFECKPAALHGALDRFAQFFIAPLCCAAAMEREVNAVDSEFVGVLQSDESRRTQLMCHTAKPNHIYRKFTWGNKKSLWDDPAERGIAVRDELIQYYKQHYSADAMALVVLGGESLDTMAAWVRDMFAHVPTCERARSELDGVAPPFSGSKLYISPSVREGHELNVTFQLPCQQHHYWKKADEYLAHIIGHEGPGSLLSALKARGWATALEVGVEKEGYSCNSVVNLFTVSITLTDAGVNEEPGCGLAAVGLLFGIIALLRKQPPQEWIYQEKKAIAEMDFRWEEDDRDAMEWVTDAAAATRMYTPQHTLVGSYLHDDWDPQLVTKLLDCMQPSADGMRIDLQTARYDDFKQRALQQQHGVEDVEPWFKIPFVAVDIDAKLLHQWSAQSPPHDLTLPPRNPYIPTDFTLCAAPLPTAVAGKNGVAQAASNGDVFPQPPRMLRDEPGLRVWHKLDAVFRTPRTSASFRVFSKHCYSSARHAALARLAVHVLRDRLNEDAYSADIAGLQYSVMAEGLSGIEIRVEGFSHKLPLLVERVFQALAALEADERTFASVKEALVRKHRNAHMHVAKHSKHLRLYTSTVGEWPAAAILTELETLTQNDIKAFACELLQDVHVEALIVGNIESEPAVDLALKVKALLGEGARGAAAQRSKERSVKLSEGVVYTHAVRAVNVDEDNSACENYYQCCLENPRDEAMVDLVDQLVLEPCYDTLRTKEQLGYTVSSGMRSTHGVLGFCIIVVSGSYSPTKLDQSIEAFLCSFEKKLKKMSKAEFDDNREALIADKTQKLRSISEEAGYHWDAIWSQRYNFNRRAAVVGELRSITLKDIQKWFGKYLSPASPTRRKLSIQVFGRAHAEALQASAQHGSHKHAADSRRKVDVRDIELLKANLSYFPNLVQEPQGLNNNQRSR